MVWDVVKVLLVINIRYFCIIFYGLLQTILIPVLAYVDTSIQSS